MGLKIKAIFKAIKSPLGISLLGVFCVFFFFPNIVKAADYKPENISVQVDMLVNGKNANFARVGKDGTLKIQVDLTLVSPDKLVMGFGGGMGDFLDLKSWAIQNRTIEGFGAGFKPKTNSTDYQCQNLNLSSATGLSSSNFMDCRFVEEDQTTRFVTFKTVNKGEKLYSGTISISGSDLTNLGIISTSATAANEFYIYPYLIFDNKITEPGLDSIFGPLGKLSTIYLDGSSINLVYSPGKSFFVQLYDKDTDAKAADAANAAVPSNVPVYGSVIATGSATSDGSPLLGLINKIIGFIIGLLNEIVFGLFYLFVAPLLQAVLSIRTYTDTFAGVIYPGWVVLRNLCNIVFIAALIAIAMGTLLRLEKYQYKHLLVQLILAALMVNFSLVIGQAVLGVADTVQNQFLPNNEKVIQALAKDLMVNYRTYIYDNSVPLSSLGSFSDTFRPFFLLIMATGSFMVFLAIAAFLLIRICMLWILLMLSPLAYAAGILPSTEHFRKEWWENFLKYAFFTPIMAFFLNFTAILAVSFQSNTVFQSVNATSFGDSGLANFIFRIASNIVLVVFLLVALQVAEKAGIFGAKEISGFAKKGMFAPAAFAGWGAKRIGGYVGRKYNEATAKYIRGNKEKVSMGRAIGYTLLNPIAWAKGWNKEAEEKKHRAQEKAEAAGLEVVQQRFSSPKAFFKGGYKILPHVLTHEKQEEDDKTKLYQSMSREKVSAAAHRIFMMSDDEDGAAYKRGIIKLAMSKGYIDDIVGLAHTNGEGQKMLDLMKKEGWVRDSDFINAKDEEGNQLYKKGIKGKDKIDADGNLLDKNNQKIPAQELLYNNRTRRALYKAMYGVDSHGHLKDHAAMRMITEEGEKEGMDTGHLEYMTDQYYDSATGEYEWYKMDEDTLESEGEVKMAGREIAKRDSRKQASLAWHSLMSGDGKYFSEGIFKRVAKAFKENPTWMQERQANKLVTGMVDGDEVDRIAKTYKENDVLEISEVARERISQMMEADAGATVAILQRFINEGQNVQKRAQVLASGKIEVRVNGVNRDITFPAETQATKPTATPPTTPPATTPPTTPPATTPPTTPPATTPPTTPPVGGAPTVTPPARGGRGRRRPPRGGGRRRGKP